MGVVGDGQQYIERTPRLERLLSLEVLDSFERAPEKSPDFFTPLTRPQGRKAFGHVSVSSTVALLYRECEPRVKLPQPRGGRVLGSELGDQSALDILSVAAERR